MFQIIKAAIVLAAAVSALPTEGHNTPSETCSSNNVSHCCYDEARETEAHGLIPIIGNLGHCYPVQVPVIAGAVQGGDACKGGQVACCGPQNGVVNAGCAVPVDL
ncbi:hypothetical protein NLG97_g6617 [Lecanicillium saksenae]|uniref:Uncharacterized protein n=1 Tax=Lecanicillium saksenae TaxID=468837 RepID=A0ACC1QS86_9HYPO|nr:hypothetical protein NLG97_g6617 [Lecanicillium saksenae]